MPNLRMMICVSTPGSSMRPSTSLTVPAGPRVALGQRVIDDHDHVAGLGRRGLAGGNLDVGDQTAIERHHVAEPRGVHLEPSDHALVGTFEDLHEPPFEPLLGVLLHAGDDGVAVHRLGQGEGRDVDVGVPLAVALALGGHEAEAGRVHLEASDHEVHLLGQTEAVAAHLHELAARSTSALRCRVKVARCSRGTLRMRARSRAVAG